MLLHAYVDGELDPANAVEMEQRIATDPALAGEYARITALRRALAQRVTQEPVPVAVRARIRRSFGLASEPLQPSWHALAASIVAAALVSGSVTWWAVDRNGHVADGVLGGHLRALMAQQPTDVSSSDRHTVKPWFNGRVPQAPRVVDLTQDGFPLVGGRIDVVGRATVPTLVYRHRQHLISLTAVPGTKPDIWRRSIQGYNFVGWTSDGIGYWAVSDLGASDLDKFARLFREARPDQR